MLLSTACTRPLTVSPPLDGSAIVNELESARNTEDIPAIAAIVVRADTMLQGAAVGVRKTGDPDPVNIDQLFHLGTLTKAVTATTIGGLIEEGKLSWESKPSEIFPDWKETIHPLGQQITLDQLLRHSSGLTAFLDDTSPEVKALPVLPEDPVEGRQAFARQALSYAPMFTPGSRRQYSNAGYVIAAAMAEEVSGMPWEDLVQKRLFEPLGIQTAVFGWTTSEEPESVWGHMEKEANLEPLDKKQLQRPAWRHPAEDLYLSIKDYGSFLQLHLQGLQGKDNILQASTIKYLHEPMGIDPEGLGWIVEKKDKHLRSLHNGTTNFSYATVQLQAKQDIAVAIFSNRKYEDDQEALNELLESIIGRYSLNLD